MISAPRLDALISKGEANVKDARIELKAVLESVHRMEMEGLSLKHIANSLELVLSLSYLLPGNGAFVANVYRTNS